MTDWFKVKVRLHQGSALSPFLFAVVMDRLTDEVRQKSPWTMMFADDIVICGESIEQVEKSQERWRYALERRGMKVSKSKTEYMCANKRKGSGVVRLQVKEVKKVEEFSGVSVTSPINLFIIVIYRPPGPLGDFLEEMDTLLSNFPSDGTPLTVLGDFNLPSDKLQSSCLLPFLNTFSLTFNSCPPTHKGGNVLDLVFTRPTPATDMTATPLPISDHHLVSFLITLPIQPKNNLHVSLIRPNLHSISPSSVTSCTLSSLPDPVSFSTLPLDVATDSFLSSLSSTMDLLCPLTTKPKKTSCPTPWLSEVLRSNRRELRSAERKWKKSQLDVDLSSYRALLTRFSLEVTSAKTTFYKEKLEASAQDPRKLHNIFSSLLNPPAAPAPSSLTANDFASFYDEKIRKICQTFTSSPTMTTQHSQQSTTSLSSFSTLTEDEILQVIRSCNPTTCPLDTIPSNTLQTIAQDLLPFISTIINGSLTSGYVPTTFKQARVIPILKKPALDPSDINNYRPNNLHDPNQSGFKTAHSTETALLAVSEKLHAARSAKLSSVLIFLDLSAAFDTVNHNTLLSTLKSLGICGTAWKWFASYLEGRSYQVTWRGSTSAPCRLTTGVPQGSVLGPLLFSLYTHSIGEVISSHGFSYHCYADDTQLIFSFPPSDTTASARISACLSDISLWMRAHQLKLNPSKTELLVIPEQLCLYIIRYKLLDIGLQLLDSFIDNPQLLPEIARTPEAAHSTRPGGSARSPTCLNDYHPVALTTIVMKCFEQLVLAHLKDSLPSTLDSHQFAKCSNRSTVDVVSIALHSVLTHLDNKNTYACMLFVDFSSAFNTIIPSKLIAKLVDLGFNTSTCNWIMDFLTNRPQQVRSGAICSNTITLNTGVPHGCVLSPFLYPLFTSDCRPVNGSNSIIKFAVDRDWSLQQQL
ncbi:hypothetical protein C0J50_6351 [Silurus asotus]|uniref:ribonuclease H n=1 Tax=Silurus asotus TaxID=30991 RepID=A0AAD5A3Z2_SILAS|nr:hypothetical protein C0J50_6351 [Silurus asotus]